MPVGLLCSRAAFNEADQVHRPRIVERTDECRREHRRWRDYLRVRDSASAAVVRYEQGHAKLMRDVQAMVDFNHAGRGRFYGVLSEYHPQPSQLHGASGDPLAMSRYFADTPVPSLRTA